MKIALSVAALLLAAVPVGGADSLGLSVYPRLTIQPAVIRVTVSVEPNADNRSVEVVAESANYFRSSEVQLEGSSAERTKVFQYRDLPEGSYVIRATLTGSNGRKRAMTESSVIVNP